MSTAWEIHCIDCNENHEFTDSDRMCDVMLLLIRHAKTIALLAPLMAEADARDIRFAAGYNGDRGAIDPAWFAKHAGHRLRPIDEYGGLLYQCHKSIACRACGGYTGGRCMLEIDHAGSCDPKAAPQAAPQ